MKYMFGLLAVVTFVGCTVAQDDESETSSARIIVADGKDSKDSTGKAVKQTPTKAPKQTVDGPNIPEYKAPSDDDNDD